MSNTAEDERLKRALEGIYREISAEYEGCFVVEDEKPI